MTAVQDATTSHVIQQAFLEMCNYQLGFSAVTVCFASVANAKSIPEFRRIQLTDRAGDVFRQIADGVQRKLLKRQRLAEIVFRPYAPETKLDEVEVEYLNLSNNAEIAGQIGALSALAEMRDFDLADEAFIKALRFYVIVIQPADQAVPPLYFFRTYTPSKILGRSRAFGLIWRDAYFDRVADPVVIFDQEVDCISWGTHLFILKKDLFQRIFRYFERLQAAAQETLAFIKRHIPIANFEQMERDIHNHLFKLAKLRSIMKKPYLARLTIDDLRAIITSRHLAVRIAVVDGQEMLVYNQDDPWPMLRLLDDDYLTSLMTGMDYEATVKRDAAG